MSAETGFRTILAHADGTVAIHTASGNRRGQASLDAHLSRAESKAMAGMPGARIVERKPLDRAPSDRRLRNAWRINALTGRVVIDLAAARELRASQWVHEAAELDLVIRCELLPRARILNQPDVVVRLNSALQQIQALLIDLGERVPTMTESELASFNPNWPSLK